MNEKLQPVHEQYAEDLALYALGALHAGSCAQLEQHLKECAACRRELETMRGDAALLALSVSGPTPPARSRQRRAPALVELCARLCLAGAGHLRDSTVARKYQPEAGQRPVGVAD